MSNKIFNQFTDYMKRHWQIYLLVFLSAISHHYIFLDKNILCSGDWVYYFKESSNSLSNYLLYLQPYGFGKVMPFPNNYPFYLIAKIFFDFNFDWDIFTRIIFLIPIAIFTPVFSYLSFKSILNNRNSAFISSLVYIFNTFFLKLQLDWVTYANIWWILPLCFLLIKYWFSSKQTIVLPILSLILSLSIILEIRITLIVYAFIIAQTFLYTIYYPNIRPRLKYFISVLIAVIFSVLIHSFWILPVKFGGLFNGLIGYADTRPFISFYGLLDVLTLHSYQWANNSVFEPFINQRIDPQLYIIPFLAFFGLYKLFKSKTIITADKILIPITLLIFIFLSKQENPPFTNAYKWFYNNIPLFNIYRESSKFIIIVAFALSILAGFGCYEIFKTIKKKSMLLGLIFIIATSIIITSNSENFFTQKIGGMTKGIEISDQDYKMVDFLTEDTEFYRVMWYPYKPRFAYYSDFRPYVLREDYKSLIKDFNWYTDQNKTDKFWDLSSIKYVIIPPANEVEVRYNPSKITTEIDGFRNYGNRDDFISRIQKLSFLNRIDSPEGYVIYENKDYRNNFYFTLNVPSLEIDNEFINPEYYEGEWKFHSKTIDIKSVQGPFYLTFNNVYSPLWEIRIGTVNWVHALFEKGYFLNSDQHIHNSIGSNTFYINPQTLCIKGNSNCIQNTDGSYDIKLTLYFKPMILAHLGGVISSISLVLLIVFVMFNLYKQYTDKYKRQSTKN